MDILGYVLILLLIKNINTLFIVLSKNENRTVKVVHWKSKNETYNCLRNKNWVMVGEPSRFKYYTSGLDFFKKEFSFDERIEETYKYSEISFPKYNKNDKCGKIISLPIINHSLTILNIIFGRARLDLERN